MASTHKNIPANTDSTAPRASADEVRKIVGRISDDRLAAILATGATATQVMEAFTWLTSDEYAAGRRQPPLTGVVADVHEILKP
jgi:hypothetical protein